MSVKADNFSKYFKTRYDFLFYDHFSARFLFLSGMRPVEFLNVKKTMLDLLAHTVTFTQAKDGLLTSRPIDAAFLAEIYEIWRVYGDPGTYYNSYSTLLNYIKRVCTPKQSYTNRLNDLYAFRYSCAGSLLLQGYSNNDVIQFFNHRNPANTAFYISQGQNINTQLTT
jgi:integrase